MGNLAARFNPVTLDFRNAAGAPAHTLLWLRNGGGKTTLLSLVYSTLLPKKLDWLGKHNGKPTELADYLFEKQLGFILIEFAFADGARRLVGQSILKRGPRELSQVFFTFRTDGPLPFEQIPVLGLGPPAPTREAFFATLEALNRQDPAGFDFYKFDRGQRSLADWHHHLVQVGIDPGVYKSHLVMNSDEGGLGEFFDFRTSDSFVFKLLDMADDPPALPDDEEGRDATTEAIDQFRRKALDSPNLECELRLCRRLQTGLEAFQARLSSQQAAMADLRTARRAAAQLLFSAKAFLADLGTRMGSARAELKAVAGEVAGFERGIENLREYGRAYNRIRRRFRASEAEAACQQCERDHRAAASHLNVLQAAAKLQALRTQETRVAEFRRLLAELLAEKRPQLDDLRRLGGRLHRALLALANAIRVQQTKAGERRAELRRAAQEAEERLRATARAQGAADQVIDRARRALLDADNDRRRLREQGLIVEDETPAQALERVNQTIQRKTEEVQRHSRERGRLQGEEHERNAAAAVRRDQALAAERLVAALAAKIDRFNADIAALQADPVLRRHAAGTPDVYNPALRTALEGEVRDLETAIQRLNVEGAADERRLKLHQPPEQPLFPPPPGIERVLALLRARGVASAVSGYQWLDGACTLSDAQARLRRDPAAFCGIIIQDEGDWTRAVEVAAAEGIDLPIALTPLKSLPAGGAATAHVILPQDSGLYNASVAGAERPVVEARAQQRSDEAQDHRHRRDAATRALGALRDFLGRCPAELLPKSQEELASLRAQAQGHQAAAQAETVRAADLRARSDVELEAERAAQGSLQELGAARVELERHKRDHADRVEEHRRRDLEAVAEKDRLNREEREQQECRTAARREDEGLDQRIASLAADSALAGQRLEGVPPDYVGPAQDPEPEVILEQLEAQFVTARQAYEGAINQTGYKQAIDEAERERAARAQTYHRAVEGLKIADVEIAAQFDPISHEIDEQERSTVQAKTNLDLAQREFAEARHDLPAELGRDQRETVNPSADWPRPETAAAAAQCEERCDQEAAAAQRRLEQARVRHTRLSLELKDMESLHAILERIPAQMEALVADIAPGEPHPGFRGSAADADLAEKIRHEVDTQRERHDRAKDGAADAFARGFSGVLTAPEFADRRLAVVERFAALTQADVETRLPALIAGLAERALVVENSLAALDQDRANVVAAMAQRAQEAAALLRSAANLSTMPEGIGVWAGHHFLKITVPQKGDEAERKTHLRRLLEYWTGTQANVPAGAALAHACLLGSIGSVKGSGEPQPSDAIEVQILKPEATPRVIYYPIVMMKSFSGGELVTAAIQLYCILARVRAQRRGTDSAVLAKDAGFLLLDNPVGKANLPGFLDLQIQTADILGVQYVCGTGINDPDAIGAFPKVIRMRNSALNPRTNANLVQVVPAGEDHALEAAHLAVAANARARAAKGAGEGK
jgi:hypothetical protein